MEMEVEMEVVDRKLDLKERKSKLMNLWWLYKEYLLECRFMKDV